MDHSTLSPPHHHPVTRSVGSFATNSSARHDDAVLPAYSGFPPLALREWHHVNERLVGVLSILANSLLFLILARERNEALRPYARVLLQNCVVDFLFTVVASCFEWQMEFADGRVVVIVRSAIADRPHYYMAWLWMFMCASAINISPVIFYFRYVLVCKGRLLSTWEMVRIVTFPIVYSMIETSALTMALWQGDSQRAEMCPKLLDHPLWWQDADDPRSPIFTCMYSDGLNPFLLLYLGTVLVMILLIYVVMVYYGMAVYRTMRSSTLSAKSVAMQRQMNWMLFTQMIVPLFTSIIPVTVMMNFALLRITVYGIGIIGCMCVSWVPLVSPLTTIALVANFRRRAVNYIFFCCGPIRRTLNGAGGDAHSMAVGESSGKRPANCVSTVSVKEPTTTLII